MNIKEIMPDGRDVWDILAETDKPIAVYGTGNGVDKLIDVCTEKGIRIADFFASDGFVRDRMFHGKKVLSYGGVSEKYDDFIVVVGFGSHLPEVMENVRKISLERETYIPELPVSDGVIFDKEFYFSHEKDIAAAREMFSDMESRRLFDDIVAYRLSGKPEFLSRTTTPKEIFTKILDAENFRVTADLGAYDGDSIRELAGFAPSLEKVVAFEPDERSFRKLTAFAESGIPYTVETINAAAWNESGTLDFTAEGNRNSTLSSTAGIKAGAKIKKVRVEKPDDFLSENCDYIKFDVEGAELRALAGCAETIYRAKPQLLVSAYHRSEDIFELPRLIHGMGYKKLFFRRYAGFPAWDLNILATD